MSTAYIYGPTTAHVAKYDEVDNVWESQCGYRVTRDIGLAEWTDRKKPVVPWCTSCKSRVRELAVDVLGYSATWWRG